MRRATRRARGLSRVAPIRRTRGRRYAEYAATLALLLLLALVASRLDRAETLRPEGRATVNDGDTLTLSGERIRLRGIDAPEFGQTCRRGGVAYPCGRQSRQQLVRAIGDRRVTCEGWERDRYDRLLATCFAGDRDLNRLLVAEGWAVAYGDYADAEREARRAGKGLWAGEFDRPRDWRETHGGLAEIEHGQVATAFAWLRQVIGW